ITSIPNPLTFGNVAINGSAVKTVTLENTGLNSVTINSVSLSSSFFTLVNPPSFPFVIPTSGSASLDVKFAPLATVPINASLNISSTATAQPWSVQLSGNGIGPPQPPATGITVFTDKPAYRRGQPVQITGKVTTTGGAGIPNVPVQVQIGLNGSTRTSNPYTDFQGSYQTTFVPTSSDGGSFTVTAVAASGAAT